MNAIARVNEMLDPAGLGWPATLPLEVALRTAPLKDICAAYGLSREEWDALRANPRFIADVQANAEELKKDGMSFKVKAKMQAEELLKRSWKMIHEKYDVVPPSVQADLIKVTIRAAGLDGSKDQAANAIPQNALQINIVL